MRLARGLELSLEGRFLHLDLEVPHECLSWALIGPRARAARRISWIAVRPGELPPGCDAREQARRWCRALRPVPEVVLLTGRRLAAHQVAVATAGSCRATCVSTVGLGNALRPGDRAAPPSGAGTINQVVVLSRRLSKAAFVEAVALVASARTLALCEEGVGSVAGSGRACGTGTDCIVVAAPGSGPALDFVGMHTPMGEAIGRSVLEATRRGARQWLAELADGSGRGAAGGGRLP